jgi:hypothetical protein
MGDKMWSTRINAALDRNARFWAPAFASRWCIPASLLLSAAMIIYLCGVEGAEREGSLRKITLAQRKRQKGRAV